MPDPNEQQPDSNRFWLARKRCSRRQDDHPFWLEVIACIAPNLTDFTFASIIDAAEVEARALGFGVVSASAETRADFASLLDRLVAQRRVDGVLVINPLDGREAELGADTRALLIGARSLDGSRPAPLLPEQPDVPVPLAPDRAGDGRALRRASRHRRLADRQRVRWQWQRPVLLRALHCGVPGLVDRALWRARRAQPGPGQVSGSRRSSRCPEPRFASGPSTPGGRGAGRAALSEQDLGRGRAVYVGWNPGQAQAEAVLRQTLPAHGVFLEPDLPPGLVLNRRGPFTILLNFTDRPLSAMVGVMAWDVPGRDIVIRRTDGE